MFGYFFTLQAVTILNLLPYNIEDRVNKLSTLSVVALCEVVSGTRLAENKVVRPENLAINACAGSIHGTRLKVHKHCPWHVTTIAAFIVINVHSFKLKFGVPYVLPCWVNPMFITHHLPELCSYLVPALPSLYVQNLTHFLAWLRRQN